MVNCSSDKSCDHRSAGGSYCEYEGYCDFQLPRDSRIIQQTGTGKCQCMGKLQITSGICPYCGLQIS